MSVYAYDKVLVWMSEDNFLESILSFYYVGPRYWTLALRLGGKHLFSLNCFAWPLLVLVLKCVCMCVCELPACVSVQCPGGQKRMSDRPFWMGVTDGYELLCGVGNKLNLGPLKSSWLLSHQPPFPDSWRIAYKKQLIAWPWKKALRPVGRS